MVYDNNFNFPIHCFHFQYEKYFTSIVHEYLFIYSLEKMSPFNDIYNTYWSFYRNILTNINAHTFLEYFLMETKAEPKRFRMENQEN